MSDHARLDSMIEVVCEYCEKKTQKRKREKTRVLRFCSTKCADAARVVPVEERFWEKVKKKHGCWEWLGGLMSTGYGYIYLGEKTRPRQMTAHRYSFMLHGGKIPKDYVVDHTCMNRSCVNPKHLRAVTVAVNVIENSRSPSALNKKKTQCTNGHEFSKENTKINGKGQRTCKECSRANVRRYRKNNLEKCRERNREWMKKNSRRYQ